MLESMKAAGVMTLYLLSMPQEMGVSSPNPLYLSSIWAEIWDIKREAGNDMRQDLVNVYETCRLSSRACQTALIIPDS